MADASLLTWIGTFAEAPIESFAALRDGELLYTAARCIFEIPELSATADPSSKFSLMRDTLEEFYGCSLREDIPLPSFASDELFEPTVKQLLVYLLCAAMNCPRNEKFINALRRLDETSQTHLMQQIASAMPRLFPSAALALDDETTSEPAQADAQSSPVASRNAPCSSGTPLSLRRLISSNTPLGRSPLIAGTPVAAMSAMSRVHTPGSIAFGMTPDPKRNLIASLRNELRQARAQAEEAQCLHDELLREMTLKSRAFEDLTVRFREASQLADRAQSLQDQIDSLHGASERADRLEGEAARLRKQLDAAKADQRDLQALRREYSRIQAELSEQTATRRGLEEQTREYRAKIASLEVALLDVRTTAKHKDAELERLIQQNDRLTQEKSESNRQLMVLREEFDAFKASATRADLNESRTETLCDVSNEGMAALQAEVVSLQSKLESLSVETPQLQAAQERIRELTEIAAAKQEYFDKEIATLQCSIAEKDRVVKEQLSARTDLEVKLRMTEDALVAARGEIDAARTNRRESLTRKLQADMEQRVLALMASQEDMQRRHRAELEKTEAIHAKAVQELTATCNELRARLDTAIAAKQSTPARAPFRLATSPLPLAGPLSTASPLVDASEAVREMDGKRAAEPAAPAVKENPPPAASLAGPRLSQSLRQPLRSSVNILAWEGVDDERISELKSRNKRTQPHLQCSYAVEVQTTEPDKTVVTPTQSKAVVPTAKPVAPHLRESTNIATAVDAPAKTVRKAEAFSVSPQRAPRAAPPARFAERRATSRK